MKIKSIQLTIVLFLIFSNLNAQLVNNHTLNIGSVNIYTTAFTAVSCGDFYQNFGSQIIVRKIESNDTMQIIDSFVKKVKFRKKPINMDVRAKMVYHDIDGKEYIICFDMFWVRVNGWQVKRNKTFLTFLKSCLPAEHAVFQNSVR
jgi:hypothetical protein